MKYILLLSLVVGISYNKAFAQDVQDNSVLLSRIKIGIGIVQNLSKEKDFELNLPFLNISYRSSGFDKFSSTFKLKAAYEMGISGLIISDNREFITTLYPLPFAKFGPELRLYRNTFIAANIGLAYLFLGTGDIIPFIGINGFYLFRLGDNTCVELETGFHIPHKSVSKVSNLTYITIGISLD